MEDDIREILSRCDHTLLKQTATPEDIMRIVDEGVEYKTASVCIPPAFVKEASERAMRGGVKGVRICTVIGFPNGNTTTESKCFEAREAVENGADEIDMVVNIGRVKAGDYGYVTDEIARVKNACGVTLKVIIETCFLTEEEKIKMCAAVADGGADYIKTSTGFGGGGATFEDVALMRKYSPESVKVKAAGGIKSLSDAREFIRLGADRLGTSRIVELVKNGN